MLKDFIPLSPAPNNVPDLSEFEFPISNDLLCFGVIKSKSLEVLSLTDILVIPLLSTINPKSDVNEILFVPLAIEFHDMPSQS